MNKNPHPVKKIQGHGVLPGTIKVLTKLNGTLKMSL